MKKTFIKGRRDLALTVFIPEHCRNGCHFCTSKKDYSCHAPNLDQVLKTAKRLKNIDIQSMVITGGEPLANLDTLRAVLDAFPFERVYLNTTFPDFSRKETIANIDFINEDPRIAGVNISRHTTSFALDQEIFSEDILSDQELYDIVKPIRINVVLGQDPSLVLSRATELDLFLYLTIKRWEKFQIAREEYLKSFGYSSDEIGPVSVNFRGDYRRETRESLHDIMDDVSRSLYRQNLTDITSGGCDVCHNISGRKENLWVHYHKGLEFSSLELIPELIQVNDLLVFQDGHLAYDWDRKDEDMNQLLEQWKITVPVLKPIKKIKPPVKKAKPISTGSCGGGAGATCGDWLGAMKTSIRPSISYGSCGGGSLGSC